MKVGPKAGQTIYRVQPVYNNRTPWRYFTDMIQRISALSAGDVSNTMQNLVELIQDQLKLGNIVVIDGLGTFRPTLTAEAVESPEEFNRYKVKRKRVIFTPSVELRRIVDTAGLAMLYSEDNPAPSQEAGGSTVIEEPTTPTEPTGGEGN